MLNRKHFDPKKPYRAVAYLRMSSEKQNPRSPDQQEAEIRRTLNTFQLGWTITCVYRDDAKSGRYQRNRPGLQRMLRDIRRGDAGIDLILLDTLERIGRIDDLPILRKELFERHGVLILTADSGFADPTTPQGKAFGAFEAMRATEENRIKSHQVLRGKRDLARRGFWPGGPCPFGYRLNSQFVEQDGRQVVEGSLLEPNPEQAWIINSLFERARQTGHGQTRLARFLNNHAEIPATLKPFHGSTIGYWLDQPIYYGELVWEVHSTDVVDDVRVVDRNTDSEMLRVPEFCEPLIDRELWDSVQAIRQKRRRPNSTQGRKQLKPLVAGTSLSYVLSGLVCCGHCGASMRPVTSGRTSLAGARYVYYACPRAIEGGDCPNKKHIPERWLREVVTEKIRRRLFPSNS